MTEPLTRIERRIRFAGILILISLLIELFSQMWLHPMAFLVVHMLAFLFFFAGVALYLLALLPRRH